MSRLEPVRLVAKAVVLRLRLAAMMRERSLPELLEALTPGSPGGTTSEWIGPRADRAVPLPQIQKSLSATEEILARVPIAPDTCLYRALARYAILRSAGHPARFVMGIQPGRDEITGHAWVELGGEPVGEDVDPDIVVTFAYPNSIEIASGDA